MQSILKYFFVALAALTVDFGGYLLLLKIFNFHYMLASFISFSFGFLVNFMLGRTFIFTNGCKFECAKKEFAGILVVSLIGLTINQSSLFIFFEFVTKNNIISKIIATGITFFWNFFGRAKIIYNKI